MQPARWRQLFIQDAGKLDKVFISGGYVLQEGGVSVVELLQLTTRTVKGLDPDIAVVHADAVWSFSLKVLSFRQETPTGITGVRPIEDAAIALVLALTLKLTETTFKPLFLRLVDWAAQPPSSGELSFTQKSVFPIFKGKLCLSLEINLQWSHMADSPELLDPL